MTRTRILIPIVAFLAAMAFLAAVSFLPWIPEWETFQTITLVFSWLAGFAAAVVLLRGIWLQTRESMKVGWQWLLVTATGIFAGGILYVGLIVGAFSMSGGFFAPTIAQKFEFPEYGTTIYVYDNGFLDPEALFRVRRSWLPFAWNAGQFEGWDAYHLQFERQGEWAVCQDFQVHLPTGEVRGPQPYSYGN